MNGSTETYNEYSEFTTNEPGSASAHRGSNRRAEEGTSGARAQREQEKEPTQAQTLVELTREMTLFRGFKDDEDYASFYHEGHKKTLPIKSKDFKDYLMALFYKKKGKPPHSNALQSALAVLHGSASTNPWRQAVHTRLAQMGSKIYLNLADEQWHAVEISASGWKIVSDHPVFFLRPKGMAPLPFPVEGGSVAELQQFINFADYDDFILLVSWLIGALRPIGPYPALILQGEQGSAKSTTARILRALIDPSIAPLRRLPRSERDLMIAAKNSWVLAFDNISKIPDWLSDALSSVATGGGLTTRELYSDTNETHLDTMNPILLNGIGSLATEPDLLDRAIVMHLPAISTEQRKREEILWRKFQEARPRILGALLLAVAHGIYNANRVHRRKYPRMADFAHWAAAAATGLPWEDWQFINAFETNIMGINAALLEDDAVGKTVQTLMMAAPRWEGTASELLETLSQLAGDEAKGKHWPTGANWLSNRLRKIAPSLRRIGIDVQFDTKTRPKKVIILNR